MKHFVLLSALVVLASAEIPSTEGPSQIIGVPGPRWQGPFANHILGQPVGDTAEVAAAKAAHYLAHSEILKILPELSSEEEYKAVDVVQPHKEVFIPQQPSQLVNFVPQQLTNVPVQPYVIHQANVPVVQVANPVTNQVPVVQPPVQSVPQFTQFAEDIPRSELGEVPEVAAARKAHLEAYEEIKKKLPKLQETTSVHPEVQPLNVVQQQNNVDYQQPQAVYQQPQTVYQNPNVVSQQNLYVPQVPQIVYQQPQIVNQPQLKQQQSQISNQQQVLTDQESQLWKQQLQRNLEWFYNPEQFYSYVPQDTPEVAAAKKEHLKLLQALS